MLFEIVGDATLTNRARYCHENNYLLVKGQLKAAAFLETFVEYPPSQRPASFNIEGVRKQVDKSIDAAFKKRGQE